MIKDALDALQQGASSPSRVSSALRRIASAIENSKNPSRELVARDLQDLVDRLSSHK